ncbi:MAG: hypothetical protein QNJ36_05730 [Calothrix sp. MO_167.B42]|nr:hypothetical protein [Calothrix sp. MO_167.B42]
MSIYPYSIQALIQVIESQSNLISHQDWGELHQLVISLPEDEPEDVEEISDRIENWLKTDSRNQIYQAYNQQLQQVMGSLPPTDWNTYAGIGKSKSQTKPNQPSPPYKELLDNSIKKNSPLFNPPPPKQQPSETPRL